MLAAAELVAFAKSLLAHAGVAPPVASDLAEVLVEGDLLGHDTHGLWLLAPYLAEIENGAMARDGTYVVVTDRPATALWDGQRLPGPWLVRRAIDNATQKAQLCGIGSVVIRRSHHIACLASYLEPVTRQGLAMLLTCSDPSTASVAPFGGTQPWVTPDPIAFGFPTQGEPVLIDISASITTNGMSSRLARAGQRFAAPWLMDAQGRATDDPAVLNGTPPGTILPLGGLEYGHKGYGLALIVEALTGGLAGFGRADDKPGWGATVFVQVFDPDAFGGRDALLRQTEHLRAGAHANAPRPGVQRVRLPGERGLARKRQQLEHGVTLHPEILPALAPWAEKLDVPMPAG
jgi:L-lactate dehydrogenase